MLLQEIKLSNIRSYRDGRIVFPEGSTLLSGDIGSGKSSLLLAIEFALFGSSRPDLPAEWLLRKGATQGAVELFLKVNGKDLIIKRALKKEKDSIKQTSGYIIVDGLKKELTPVELKAEVIGILGYPEDALSKNKNYIYRYTVYCPQEEMRFILQDDPEIRLDALRRIFNVDKYKNIRENMQNYLRTMRSNMNILQAKISPLDDLSKQYLQKDTEHQETKLELEKLRPLLETNIGEKKVYLDKIQLLESEQKEFQDLKHQQNLKNTLLTEKKEQLQNLIHKKEQLAAKKSHLILDGLTSLDKLDTAWLDAEKEKNNFLKQRSFCQEKTALLQQNLKLAQKEIQQLLELISIEDNKKLNLDLLQQELLGKEEVEIKKKQLLELLEVTLAALHRNESLLQESKSRMENLPEKEYCPTCQQNLTLEYRTKITENESKKIEKAQILLQEYQKKRAEIQLQREEVDKKLLEMAKKEKNIYILETELKQINEKKEKIKLLQEQMRSWSQENNSLFSQMSNLSEEKLQQLQQKSSSLQELKGLLLQEKSLEEEIVSLRKNVLAWGDELHFLQAKLQQKNDKSEDIKKQRDQLQDILETEKNLLVQKAGLEEKSKSLMQYKTELQIKIKELTADKSKLLQQQELYHWLEEFFLNLTYTLEKQMLLSIHHLFNRLFKEWFSILIDDEQVSARLDDSFTPLIEMNGYEMPFFSLSGGERTSAALAYRLALNRVINEVIQEIKTKDLLILDEPTDGFSTEQLDRVREVLEKLKLKQIIIVSHESKIESFVDNVIRIEKEEQMSRMSA